MTAEILNSLFFYAALLGSFFFAFKVLMMLIGGVGDVLDADLIDADNTDIAFHYFSANTISSFIMMFGWTGYILNKDYNITPVFVILLALAAGFFTMFVVGLLFAQARRLNSPGAAILPEEVMGTKGTVYQEIPAKGTGVVQLSLGGLIREMTAESADGHPIASHTQIEVLSIKSNEVLVVRTLLN